MSKCLKCGAHLPLVGECSHCALRAAAPAGAPLASLFDQNLHLDRRHREGERAPPSPAFPPNLKRIEPTVSVRPTLQVTSPLPEATLPPMSAGTASAHVVSQEVRARPAPLWRRVVSFAIDGGAISAIAALYLLLASAIMDAESTNTRLTGLDGWVVKLRGLESVLVPGFFLILLLALVYCAVAAFLWDGQTLGRRLLGLQLVDSHGLAPAPARSVVRALLSALSFALFLGGFWLALFDRRGQTLHDKLTSTFVVQPT